MTRILPFSASEEAKIRRLLRNADPAKDITLQDLARIERLTLSALGQPSKLRVWERIWRPIWPQGGTALWPAAAFGAVMSGVIFGNIAVLPASAASNHSLIAVAAAEPWQQCAEDTQGDTP